LTGGKGEERRLRYCRGKGEKTQSGKIGRPFVIRNHGKPMEVCAPRFKKRKKKNEQTKINKADKKAHPHHTLEFSTIFCRTNLSPQGRRGEKKVQRKGLPSFNQEKIPMIPNLLLTPPPIQKGSNKEERMREYPSIECYSFPQILNNGRGGCFYREGGDESFHKKEAYTQRGGRRRLSLPV